MCWRVSWLGGECSNLRLELLFGGARSIGRLVQGPSNEPLKLGSVHGLVCKLSEHDSKATRYVLVESIKLVLLLRGLEKKLG
jgi:hypothetical protein